VAEAKTWLSEVCVRLRGKFVDGVGSVDSRLEIPNSKMRGLLAQYAQIPLPERPLGLVCEARLLSTARAVLPGDIREVNTLEIEEATRKRGTDKLIAVGSAPRYG
jgi:hypothetical protein